MLLKCDFPSLSRNRQSRLVRRALTWSELTVVNLEILAVHDHVALSDEIKVSAET